MPLLRLQLNRDVAADARQPLLGQLSGSVAGALGKPESYMMVLLEPETPILLAGNDEPAAFYELRSVGQISAAQAKDLSRRVSDILQSELQIAPQRVYGNFAGVDGAMWGYNGATFG